MIKKFLVAGILLASTNHALAKAPTKAPLPKNMEAVPMPMTSVDVSENDLRYTPKPAIWQFGDRDTTVYLFGSVHKLSYKLKWRSPLMDKLFANSTEYAFETYQRDRTAGKGMDVDALLDEAMPKVFHYNRPKLLDRVPAELRDELDKRTKSQFYNMPRYIMNGMPSMLAVQRLFPELQPNNGRGLGPGVEDVLMPEVAASGKPAFSLDEAVDAVTALWGWDENDQDALLVTVLQAAKTKKFEKPITIGGLDEGELRWATGYDDTANLDSFGLLRIKSARNALLHDRNAKWVVKLVDRLKRPGRVFVTVGAAHLDGPDSVQSMLEAQGIKVTRIQ
jgi:uncharacterized protein